MNSKRRSIELDELVNAQCEGVLTDQQAAQIEELLAGDAELRRDYILYMHVHALAERGRGTVMDEIGSQVSAAEANGESAALAAPSAPVALPPSAFDEPSPQGFLGSAYHDTLSYFSSGWPVAYLVATVIFGLGLLIGSLCTCVPARAGCPSNPPLSPLISPLSPNGRPDHRHGRLQVGKGVRGQGSGVRDRTTSNPEFLIPNPSSPSATSSPWPPA